MTHSKSGQLRLLVVFVLAAVSQACTSGGFLFGGGRPVSVNIPHPSAVDLNQFGPVEFPAVSMEQQRNLPPGTLSQFGRLVRADAQSLCFEVTLHGTDQRYADFRNWTIQVRSSDGGSSSAPLVQQSQPITTPMDGLVPQTIQTGTETICAQRDQYNACQQWVTRPIEQTQWVPGIVDISAASGSVCFANDGLVVPGTTAIALRLNASDLLYNEAYAVDSPARITFQWNFVAQQATAAPAPAPGG